VRNPLRIALDPRTQVGSVTLRVSDAQRVLGLYSDVLGLKASAGPDGSVEVHAPDGPAILHLIESPGAPPAPARSTGLFHTAFRWPTRAGLSSVLARLLRAGYPLTGASDHGVSEALYLDDPDGNGVELYWDRPRSTWPRDADGGLVMFTERLDVPDLLAATNRDEAPDGVDIGHVHLKTADVERSVDFWRDAMGMDLTLMFAEQAAFLSAGGYHHHVGANTWYSRGGPPLDEDALGLTRVTLALPDAEAVGETVARLERSGVEVVDGRVATGPDGVPVELANVGGG
jgi:catechol 2,3-dioxygenase